MNPTRYGGFYLCSEKSKCRYPQSLASGDEEAMKVMPNTIFSMLHISMHGITNNLNINALNPMKITAKGNSCSVFRSQNESFMNMITIIN